MIGLAWRLALTGWGRMALVAVCTAAVSGLLLVALAIAQLPPQPREVLSNIVADPGVRGGTVFATVLLTVPVLLLLHQALRLGSAARERRLAGLRLAGATPAEVARLGALEVALPAAAGSVLGVGVYGVLRATLGGSRQGGFDDFGVVPTTVAPAWWQVVVVIVVVTLAGAWAGTLPSRRLLVSPLGVTRRQPVGPPQPWGLALLVAAPVVAVGGLELGVNSTAAGVAGVALAVAGIATLGPWVAHLVGRRMRPRARSAALLLAASTIAADPRAVGRASAAVGGIALVSGGTAVIGADLLSMAYTDAGDLAAVLLVGLLLVAAMAVVAWTLAVHTVESLLDHKRSTAALAAGGVSLADHERAQRLECALTALPLAVLGVAVSTVGLGAAIDPANGTGVLLMLANLVATPALVWLMILVAVRAVRPWTVRARLAMNLRTA